MSSPPASSLKKCTCCKCYRPLSAFQIRLGGGHYSTYLRCLVRVINTSAGLLCAKSCQETRRQAPLSDIDPNVRSLRSRNIEPACPTRARQAQQRTRRTRSAVPASHQIPEIPNAATPVEELPFAFTPLSSPQTITYDDSGHMDVRCDNCSALHWSREKPSDSTGENHFFSSCCKLGDIELDQFREPPDLLRALLTGDDPRSRAFRKDLRRFNNAFAFTSVYCSQTNRGATGNGPNCFQIHGALYHITGPLQIATGAQPKFAQLYIYDPQVAADVRCGLFDGLDRQFIQDFTTYIHQHNPFPQIYKFAAERMRETRTKSSAADGIQVILNPQMRLVVEKGADKRRENLPTADEVAAIIPDEWEACGSREVILARWTAEGLQPAFSRIPATHASYMPLAYPLLFPRGDYGYHFGIPIRDCRRIGRKRQTVSIRQSYRYQLFPRHRFGLTPFGFGRLFQQFLVDVWATCDQTKLMWLRNHQSNIRADLYEGVTDVLSHSDVDPAEIGYRTILPANYIGGPRFTARCYQDSMAIVRFLGHPCLFITFTANPNWPEITRELLPG